MNTLKKTLKIISDNLFYFILASIFLGLSNLKFHGGFNFSSVICILAALIMITPSLIPLKFNSSLKNTETNKQQLFSDIKIVLITIFLNFIIYPFFAFMIGKVFFSNNIELFTGLLLLSLIPGGGMITTWALKSKAKMSLTVKIIFFNLLIAIIMLPILSTIFSSNLPSFKEATEKQKTEQVFIKDYISKDNNTSKVSNIINESLQQLTKNKKGDIKNEQEGCALSVITNGKLNCGNSENPLSNLIPIIFIIIIFPMILAFGIQKIYIKELGYNHFEKNKKYFGYFSNIGLIIILFIIMSFKNNIIIFEKPDLFLKSLIPVFLFYLLSFITSFAIYKIFFEKNKKEDGIAMFWGSTIRYITLSMAIVIGISVLNQDYTISIIIIILSYLVQIPLSFIFSKYFEKIT